MKKVTSNQSFDFKNILILALNQLALCPKRVSLMILFSFSLTTISAQNGTSDAPVILDVNAYISSLKDIERNYPSSFSNAKNVENLVYALQSSIYLNSGVVKTFGDNPKNIYTDLVSLNGISSTSISKSNIEIVIININTANDLNSKIDLSLFSSFYKLKFIYIVSRVNISSQNIAKMLVNYDDQYSIFYKIEKGE